MDINDYSYAKTVIKDIRRRLAEIEAMLDNEQNKITDKSGELGAFDTGKQLVKEAKEDAKGLI